jgi:hypothetical protein
VALDIDETLYFTDVIIIRNDLKRSLLIGVNPFSNLTAITSEQEKAVRLKITDLHGKELQTITINPYQTMYIGEGFKSGTYFVQMENENKTYRIVKID